jgi:hypothetical protein
MIQDSKKWNIGISQLAAFMQHIPTTVDEEDVEQFHGIVKILEEASGEDLSYFKIPNEKLAPRITGARPGGYGGGPGSVTYSQKKYCDSKYFYSQVHGLSNYIGTMHVKTPTKAATPDDRPSAPAVPTHSTVINVDRSNLNVLSPGASITVASDFKSDDFRKLIEDLKLLSSTQELSPESREQIKIDIDTVEVQISSARPRPSIIKECLTSMKNILESAAGGVLASGILLQLQRYLS